MAYQSQRKKIQHAVDVLLGVVSDIADAYDLCQQTGSYQGLGTMKHDLESLLKEIKYLEKVSKRELESI